MKRHQQILAAVLAVQVILSVIVFWPRSGAAQGEGALIFPDLTADAVVSLTLIDEQRNTLTLRREGEGWLLEDADGYPAQAEKVTEVLEKLARLDDGSMVTRTDASHRALKVAGDEYVLRIDVALADGTEHIVYLGTAPRYTATHFRVAGQNETYLTSELATWELSTAASAWVNTVYQDIDKTTLAEVVLENSHGTFTLVKAGEAWALADLQPGEELATGEVNDVLNKAARVTMVRPLGKTEEPFYGFDVPTATVTLKTGDGDVTTLRVGAPLPGETNYAVKSSASEYYVAVSAFSVESLAGKTREDFMVEAPAEPEPGPVAP